MILFPSSFPLPIPPFSPLPPLPRPPRVRVALGNECKGQVRWPAAGEWSTDCSLKVGVKWHEKYGHQRKWNISPLYGNTRFSFSESNRTLALVWNATQMLAPLKIWCRWLEIQPHQGKSAKTSCHIMATLSNVVTGQKTTMATDWKGPKEEKEKNPVRIPSFPAKWGQIENDGLC